jgi:hypothetical protein
MLLNPIFVVVIMDLCYVYIRSKLIKCNSYSQELILYLQYWDKWKKRW